MADQPAKSAKRRVKNPETFRERAVKAAEVTDKPKRTSKVKSGLGKVFKPIFRPIGRFFRALGKYKIVRFFGKIGSFIGKILVPPYFRSSAKELKLVTWPNWKQSRSLTYAVLAFAVVFGAMIAIVDYGLDKLFKHILLK